MHINCSVWKSTGYNVAMLNRDIKQIFWIVPVMCVIFWPIKGKFIRVSLKKVYIYLSPTIFVHIESIIIQSTLHLYFKSGESSCILW